jgi:hypothetical protein
MTWFGNCYDATATCAQWLSLLDATVKIVPAWQRGLIARLVMVARPIHNLLIDKAPCWLLNEVDKDFRGFLWSAKDRANGGQCLVAWNQVYKLQEFGGLRVKNLCL